MSSVVIIAFVCVLIAIAAYGVFFQAKVLPGAPAPHRAPEPAGPRPAAVPGPPQAPARRRARRLRELPDGCLVTLIIGAIVWFLLWGLVLVLALGFLRDPFGG